MIRYALACTSGHRFESWFANSDAFDALVERNILTCPVCGASDVAKAIMAPAVVATRGHAVAPATAPLDVSLLEDGRKELRDLVKAFRDKVLANTRDVGARFPDEARRMHDGDIPHADIRGQATHDEALALLEDGIIDPAFARHAGRAELIAELRSDDDTSLTANGGSAHLCVPPVELKLAGSGVPGCGKAGGHLVV